MNEYTVELRIEAALLSPQQVTADLGLIPSLVKHAGDRRGHASVFTKSLWAFRGRQPDQGWQSIEEGLRQLLSELSPRRSDLQPYFLTCDVYWWCGSFQSEFESSVTLSAADFKSLAEFGAPLFLSSYFSEQP